MTMKFKKKKYYSHRLKDMKTLKNGFMEIISLWEAFQKIGFGLEEEM